VGQGASGRNAGFAISASHFTGGYERKKTPLYQRVLRINNAGLNLLRTFINEHQINCEWDENGFLHTAADKKALSELNPYQKYLETLQISHTILNRDELANRLGTPHYQAGIHVHQGALMQPAALVYGLANNLPKNVTLAENTPVLSIKTGAHSTLVLPDGEVKTDNLILATNYEAAKIGFLRNRLVGSTLSGSFTKRLKKEELASLGTLKQWGVLSLHGGGATVRLTNDGRICLRNTAEYHGGKLLSDKIMSKRQTIHRLAFEKRFPQLAHIEFEYSWSGVEGISFNGTNFFGKQSENIFLAGGYNGSGVSRGTSFGRAIAEYASNIPSDLVDDCSVCATASFVPPRPFLDIGAALT
ncbi:hypothetical protein MNBD_GAMMA04-1256, partial [hydrothermal vent metagenome]